MPFGVWTRKHVLDGTEISTREQTILRAKRGQPRTCPAVDILKRFSRGQHRYSADADGGVLDGDNEPTVCGGDAALCQINLTTCFYQWIVVMQRNTSEPVSSPACIHALAFIITPYSKLFKRTLCQQGDERTVLTKLSLN